MAKPHHDCKHHGTAGVKPVHFRRQREKCWHKRAANWHNTAGKAPSLTACLIRPTVTWDEKEAKLKSALGQKKNLEKLNAELKTRF